jgi:hypothetical protein
MNRTGVLQHLIDKYNLDSYLELGTQSRSQNFDKVKCKKKFCVDIDPLAKADFTGSTDEFFNQNKECYSIVFVDAEHTAEQVRKDFENALKVLSPKGFIVLHDCNPETYERTLVPRPTPTGPWNGDVYRFVASIDAIKYCIDIDNGCMVVRNIYRHWTFSEYPDWETFNTNRKELLNLISWEEFVSM